MDIKELKTKSEKELHALLSASRFKLKELRFKDASHQLKDVREIRETRQLIARVFTLINSAKNK
jgi:ribosomal protein L29